MYDIIGDIHGHGGCLIAMLRRLGYRPVAGVWEPPPGRHALFLGDLINRGPDQLAVLTTVYQMWRAGNATVLMGNHEYFAMCWITRNPDGSGAFARPHTPANRRQHQAFLEAVGEGSRDHHRWVDWFSTFPLCWEGDGLRAVHACWDVAALETVKPFVDGGNRFAAGGFQASLETPDLADAVARVVKGPEIPLPPAYAFTDANGNGRTSVRQRWWHPDPRTYADLALPQPTWSMPPDPLPEAIRAAHRPYPGDRPLFFGHYARHGRAVPADWIESANLACLDFGVVREDGALAAYPWDGEARIDPARIVTVERQG